MAKTCYTDTNESDVLDEWSEHNERQNNQRVGRRIER